MSLIDLHYSQPPMQLLLTMFEWLGTQKDAAYFSYQDGTNQHHLFGWDTIDSRQVEDVDSLGNLRKAFDEKGDNTLLVGYAGYELLAEQHPHPVGQPWRSREAQSAEGDAYALPAMQVRRYRHYLLISEKDRRMRGDISQEVLTRIRANSVNDGDAPTPADGYKGSDDLCVAKFHLTTPFSASSNRKRYDRNFSRLRHYIYAGDCYQANLTQRFEANYEGSPLIAFIHLYRQFKPPYAAYIQTGEGELLSFSPESFLSIKDQRVFTRPIKGTRPRDNDKEKDKANRQALLNSEKDHAENVMIVDLLRNDLGRICETGSVKVEALCELESFSNVHHLVSTVSGTLRYDISPLTALFQVSPGGSITGAPKIRAMEIISELEEHARGPYCGTVFARLPNGHLESNIAIRTLSCKDGKAYVWGGGGIVADSELDKEYEESVAKVQHIMQALEAL